MSLIIDVNTEFSTAFFEIGGYEGELDEEGIIDIEVPCCCGRLAILSLAADQLAEIVEAARKFRKDRIALLKKDSV